MTLNTLKTILIDGDGVLYRGNEPTPGLNRFFDVLARRGISWALITNNATRVSEHYIEKLGGFGVEIGLNQIISSASVTADYLRGRFPAGAGVYVVGDTGLIETIERAGFVVHHGEERPAGIVAVVGGLDYSLTYGKLRAATLLVRSGVPFIATNLDRTIPTPDGLAPGAGTIIAALIAATDTQPLVIGKPEPTIFEVGMQQIGAEAATTAMLGDRLETDIIGGHRVGLKTIGVLTGVMTREQIAASDIKPDFLFESIAELADALDAG